MSDLLKKALQKQPPPKKDPSSDEEEEAKDTMGSGEVPLPPASDQFGPLDSLTLLPSLKLSPSGHPLYFKKGAHDLIFFCIHGAGLSASSFAPMSEFVKDFASIASFDIHGHGRSKLSMRDDPTPLDFTMEKLIEVSYEALKCFRESFPSSTFVILGHSLGGSVAVKLVKKLEEEKNELWRVVVGLIVIDVVEGSAKDALPFMKSFLQKQPDSFTTIEEAIRYSVKSGISRNRKSARLTIPDQVTSLNGKFVWRIDLNLTEKFWNEWFEGLNHDFLNCPKPKILILASPDRMDKELTIAQMQGKFKLVVLMSNVGHSLHEDDPKGTAGQLLDFLKKFKVPLNTTQLDEFETMGCAKFSNHL